MENKLAKKKETDTYVKFISCSSQSIDSLKRLCLFRVFICGLRRVKEITSDNRVEFDDALFRNGILVLDAINIKYCVNNKRNVVYKEKKLFKC